MTIKSVLNVRSLSIAAMVIGLLGAAPDASTTPAASTPSKRAARSTLTATKAERTHSSSVTRVAETTTIALPDIGTFSSYENTNVTDTFTGTGFVGMYPDPGWAHLLGVEGSNGSRTVMQVDLSGFAGLTVNSAVLSFNLVNGDCGVAHTLRATVFNNDPGNLIFSFDPPSPNYGYVDFTVTGCGNYTVDLTSLVAQATTDGNHWLGIHLQGIDDNAAMWTWSYDSGFNFEPDRAQARLTVTTGCVSPPAGMVGWWPADGDANDIVGGNDGAFNGTPAYSSGEVGEAFSFDGASYVQVPDNANLRFTSQFTLDAWINPVSTANTAVIFIKQSSGNYSYEFDLDAGGGLEVDISGDGDPAHRDILTSDPGVVSAGVWTHVATSFNAGECKIYVNGVEVKSKTSSVTSVYPGTADFVIASTPGGYFFNGLIDEAEVFSRALDPTELAGIYNAGAAGKCRSCAGAPGGMVNWWKADADVTDSQGTSDGMLQNGAIFDAGEVGQAFSLNGTGAYISTSTVAANFGRSDFTIDFWMQTSATGDQEILNKRPICGGIDNTTSFEVRMSTGGQIKFELLENGQNTNKIVTSNGSYNDGRFHHVALQRFGDTMLIYVDGNLDNSATDSAIGGLYIDNSGVFNIGGAGCASHVGDGTQTFSGLIDEVEIFNRALSQREIQEIYDAESGGKCPCVATDNSLINWWPGNGNAGDIAGASAGTLNNNVSFASGEVNQAFSFDGVNGSVFIPASNNWNFGTGDFTIDFWENSTATGRMHALSFEPGQSLSNNMDFDFNDSVGLWLFWNGGGTNAIKVGNVGDYTDGKWHHFALTRTGATLTLYIDGAAVATATYTDPIDLSGDSSSFIGASSLGHFWNGLIDEVEIFSRALSANEIANLSEAGGAGKCRALVSISASANSGGSASGGGTFRKGDSVEVTATPAGCYQFVNWTVNSQIVSTSATYDFAAGSSETLVATFSKTQYGISISASPSSGGTVTGDGNYDCGSQVTLHASPTGCFTFVNWTENGNPVSSSADYTFIASASRTLVANFSSASCRAPTIKLSGSPSSVTAGQNATFTFTASPSPHAAATIHFAMSGGAKQGTDYSLSAGSIILGPTQSSATVVLHDLHSSSRKNKGKIATMQLQKGTGYTVGSPSKASISVR